MVICLKIILYFFIGTLTGVDGSTNDPTKRVPRSIVKPVVKLIETLLRQKASCTVIEVRIKLVNNRLESQHREETT